MISCESASLWAKLGNWARATAILHVGLQTLPQRRGPQAGFGRTAAQHGPQVHELVAVLAGDVSV